MTRERDVAVRLLAEEYGDPLEDVLLKRAHWQSIYDEQMAKPSRHRNVKKLAEAEDKILRYNVEALPYMRPRYQAIAHTSEAPRATVIRAPETVSDTQAWLVKHAPQRDAAINDRPSLPFVTHLKSALKTADAIGVQDAGEILDEARRLTDLDADVEGEETQMDKLRSGKLY